MFTSGPSLTAKGQAFVTVFVAILWLVLVSSLADQLINMLPFRTTQVDWRFAAAGSYLALLPQLTLQLGLLVAVGTVAASRSSIRLVSILAVIFGVVALVVIFPFLLDFVQARRQIPIDRQTNFTIAALKTGGFGGLFALFLAWTGWKGIAASQLDAPQGQARARGIVVGK